MKKLLPLVLLVLFIGSCEKESFVSEPTLDQILNGKEVAVYKEMLTFKDKSSFDKVAEELSKKDKNYIQAWGNGLGFKSIYSIYEDAIEAEDVFLAEMVKKYGENSEVTRDEMGFSELTQKYLDKGTLSHTAEGILNMNVMIPTLAPLVNEDGLVRVGNELRQYKYTTVKIILDADYNKINGLKELKESTDKIHVAAVERQTHEIKDVGRTKSSLGRCSSVNGKYWLIAYEDLSVVNEGGLPCPVYRNDYLVTLRSLKKILGTWQNHNTGQLKLNAKYCLDHLNCDYSIKRNVECYPGGQNWFGGFDSTINFYLIMNYDTGPCVSSVPSICQAAGTLVFKGAYSHELFATGVNGTACSILH